jgi:hypothetical protein
MNVQEMMNTEDFIKSVTDAEQLAQMWLIAKENETSATADRRKIEDQIRKIAQSATTIPKAPRPWRLKASGSRSPAASTARLMPTRCRSWRPSTA